MRTIKFARKFFDLYFQPHSTKKFEVRTELKEPGWWQAVDAETGFPLGLIRLSKTPVYVRQLRFLCGVDAKRAGFHSTEDLKSALRECYPQAEDYTDFFFHKVASVSQDKVKQLLNGTVDENGI
jgi:hypothetical protein